MKSGVDKLILIGFRASGKTTVGRYLAEKLGWRFVDADKELEKRMGKTIKEAVEEKGWSYFRSLEREFLKELVDLSNVVISLGGGAVLHEEELKALARKGIIVWLYARPEELVRRIASDEKTSTQRPSLIQGLSLREEVEKLLTERNPLYEKFSHIKVDTSLLSPKEVVERIFIELEKQGKSGLKPAF